MPKYIVTQGPVEHDGKPFEEGAELSLPEAVAAPLVAAGAIEPKGKPAPAETPAETPAA